MLLCMLRLLSARCALAKRRSRPQHLFSFAQTWSCWPCAQVDSKKELEKLLRATCEAFIMAVTKLAVEPMLSFITKVTAVKVAASSAGRGKPLREQVSLLPSPSSTCCAAKLPASYFEGSHQPKLSVHAEWSWSWSLRSRMLGMSAVRVVFAAPTFK